MKRLFSLVVPTYNVEPYLDEFLDSLASQTYPIEDIEIVFVDDGSTDSSAAVIAKWVRSNQPTARLLRKENGGLRRPVAEGVTGVLDEFERLVERGMTPEEPSATRMTEAFAFRDGRCSERVFEAILSARRPLAYATAYRRPER